MIFVLLTNIEEIRLCLSICASWASEQLLIIDLRLFIALDFCSVSSPVQCGSLPSSLVPLPSIPAAITGRGTGLVYWNEVDNLLQ